MTRANLTASNRKFDRDFILSPEKRNHVIDLWEVENYGRAASQIQIMSICMA
jgi:hypothetical protein